ncbi:hypothetical protein AGMMS49965_17780 [Bacteroidia bacterium]|nr:hypothetical protein AGMMS49965_17780 [Bacteroidia bacterium]
MAKEFLVEGALCTCQLGTLPGTLKVVDNRFATANGGKLMGTSMTLGNVFDPPGFGMCNLNPSTPKPCLPTVTQWTGHFDSLRIGPFAFALTEECKATCATGMPDCIAPTTTGQIPIPSVKKWAETNPVHEGDISSMGEQTSLTEHQIDFECTVGELRTLPTPALKVPVVAPRAQISLPIFDPFEKPLEKLRIKSVQFTKEDCEAGDTIAEEAGTSVEFCIEFNRRPLPSDKIKCAFFTKYPGKSEYEEMPGTQKEMTVPGQICFWSVKFREKKAGATIACSFFLNSPALPSNRVQPTVRYIYIKSQEKSIIKEVYWSTEEVAKFGEKSPERKEICRNEDAFLHIHTRGLFGREVIIKICYKESATNGTPKYFLLLQFDSHIKNNVLGFIVPGDALYNQLIPQRAKKSAALEVVAIVEIVGIDKKIGEVIQMKFDRAKNPTKSTVKGIPVFAIGPMTKSGEKEKEKCPNCEKDLTMEDMKKIFSDCKDSGKLQTCMDMYNKYMKNFHMNTCWNKAHFFAQALAEVGTSLTIQTESFNHYWERLITLFRAFKTEEGKKKAKEWGREVEERGHKDNVPVPLETQKKIANWAYSKPGNDLGNVKDDDGWRFRGRGLVQLTGRENYTKANVYTLRYANTDITTEEGINKVGEPTCATIASMGYWFTHDLHNKVHTARKNTEVISKAIGKDAPKKRQKAFDEVTSKLFKVDDCLWKKEEAKKDEKTSTTGINEYRIDVIFFTVSKVADNANSKTYQYNIFRKGIPFKSYTLEKNSYGWLPFPNHGDNWGRFGTRDAGGDNWIAENVCAALLGFFHSLPFNNFDGTLYYNDINAHDGRDIGHKGHRNGNDIDIRYPGSTDQVGEVLWGKAKEAYADEDRFVIVLENILRIASNWGFNTNYAYKVGIKNTKDAAVAVHQNHFHIGYR